MAFSTDDLESLEIAMASNADTVILNGRTIEFKNNAEMIKMYNFINDKLNKAAGVSRSYSLAKFS